MRKILFLLIAVFVMSDLAWSSPIDSTEAKNLAQTFYRLKFPGQAMPVFENISQSVGVEHFYIFNNVNGPGFVMVSGDDCAIPILGYSGTTNCVGGELMDNVRSWLGYYDGTIGAAVLNGDVATSEIAAQWNNLRAGNQPMEPQSVTAVAPLISTTWNQDAPYNNLCPGAGTNKALVGCVAIAMAQLMKYYNWPTTGTGSYSYVCNDGTYNYGMLSANFGATTYDWNNMLNIYQNANSGTTIQQNAVATLCYHCGVAVNMYYTPNFSGAYVTDYEISNSTFPDFPTAEDALKNYFDYSSSLIGRAKANYSDAQWISMLKSDLDNAHPLIYDGTDQTGEGGGHCFLCDGYDNTNNFHFNWGWNGWYDGYFVLSNLTPTSGGAGGGSYDYSYNQNAIFGAVPNGGGTPPNPTDCEYLHYPLPGTLDFYVLQSGGGYVSGTNYYGDLAKADYFTYSGNGSVEKLNVTFGAIDGVNGNLVFTVWADNNGTPGSVLGSKTVTLSTVYNTSVNLGFNYECVFDSPIAVSGSFFAGVDFSGTNSGIGILTTQDGSAANTGWELQSDGQWVPYNSSSSWGMSLSHAIHPYVCPVTTPDPVNPTSELHLYNDITYTPNPLQQGQSVSVEASVANPGTNTFMGVLKLVLLNANNTEAQVIGQTSCSLSSMTYNNFQFSGTVTVPAGTYQMAVLSQATGESTWALVGSGLGYSNPITVTVAGGSTPPVGGTGLNMFTDFLYTPDPLRQNTVAYVTTGIINLESTAFTGNLRLALETNDGEHVQTIQQIPVTTPLAANSHAQFNFSGNITAAPGFYNLILYYKPTGSSTWMIVGSNYNTSYQNPKSIMVAYPNSIDDYDIGAFILRPNPATDHFSIDTPDQSISRIEIFTTTGQIVHTQDNVINGENIDISFLKSGVYFVRYETAEGLGTLKLVVQ